MDINEYFLEWHARSVLEEARAVSARAALVPPRAPRVRPALAALLAGARTFYARATRSRRFAGAR